MVAITAILGGMLLGQATNILTSAPPLRRYFEYGANKAWPNALPGPEDAIVYRRRRIIGQGKYHEIMQKHGYTEERADELYKATRRMVDAGELITLMRRGELEEGPFNILMEKIGFEEREIKLLERATLFYPSPQDLIIWQAKEVFEPDAIEKYGLKNEIELIKRDAFYKAGMDDEQIENYWMAHWQHPGWTVVREMLHRTDLTEADVYEWFRLVEIPPYWREKYTAVMYEPYTRVDVRRMYDAGILGYDEVLQAYRELGYKEDKAVNLADFAVASTLKSERDLTRTQIEKGFEEDIIDRPTALLLLQDMGYDELEADYILLLKEIALNDDIESHKIDTLVDLFVLGAVTQEQLIAELNALNLQATYRDTLVAKAMRLKAAKVKMPTKADLQAFRFQGIIDDDTFRVSMGEIGYRASDVEKYLKVKKS